MLLLLGLLAGLCTLLLAGGGITLLAFQGKARLNFLEVVALSWLFGTGAVSFLLWVGGAVFSGASLQFTVTAIALALGLFGFVRARKAGQRMVFPRPQTWVEGLLAAALVLECGLLIYVSFSRGLGWDGLLNWEVKARYAFLNGGVMPAAYWSDVSRDFTHQSYPLWIPFTELWLYLWMGEAQQFWIKLIFPACYFAGAILLAVFGARLTGRRWIGLLTATLLFFVPCLTNWPGGVQVGYVDVPLSMVYLGAIGYLLLQSDAIDPAQWRIMGLCLALLPWAKREGNVLWLIAALVGVFVLWRSGHSRRALLWLVPGFLIMMGWKFFYTAMGKGPGTEFLPVTWTNVTTNLPRAFPILRAVLEEMLLKSRWSLFWPIVALAFLALLLRARDRRLLILFFAVAAPIGIYASAYVLSSWTSWMGHAEASLSRLLLHVMPVAWLAIALALRPPRILAVKAGALGTA
ncbi:MAG: hypothetical protein ABI992_07055 [Chthoniobacterales bacterium]